MWEAINFRPKEADDRVLKLIGDQHPIAAVSGPDALRLALQAYWELYGPDKNGLAAQIKRVEDKLDKLIESLNVEVDY